MTIEEFNNTRFRSGMKAKYRGGEYPIMTVDFLEALIGLDLHLMGAEEAEVSWVRCENIELIKE
jgi:hypothetical protein